MKIILFNVALAFTFGLAIAFDSYIPNAKHPDEPNKCYLRDTGDFVEIGETFKRIGKCAQYTCRDDFVFLVHQCNRYQVPGNCEVLERDLSQVYPDCCPKLKCIDDNGNEEIRNTSG